MIPSCPGFSCFPSPDPTPRGRCGPMPRSAALLSATRTPHPRQPPATDRTPDLASPRPHRSPTPCPALSGTRRRPRSQSSPPVPSLRAGRRTCGPSRGSASGAPPRLQGPALGPRPVPPLSLSAPRSGAAREALACLGPGRAGPAWLATGGGAAGWARIRAPGSEDSAALRCAAVESERGRASGVRSGSAQGRGGAPERRQRTQ